MAEKQKLENTDKQATQEVKEETLDRVNGGAAGYTYSGKVTSSAVTSIGKIQFEMN